MRRRPAAVRLSHRRRGFTLVELLMVSLILGIIATLAVPRLFGAIDHARTSKAIGDIRNIQLAVEQYRIMKGDLPLAMNDMIPLLLASHPKDPWGNNYTFNNFTQIPNGQRRKDGPLVPINKEFDIFSNGPDGQSTPSIRSAAGRDDIIFANDGGFINVASEY